MRALRPALIALSLIGLGWPAVAAEPAGSAVAVIQQASADLDGASSVITAGDGVFTGQTLITGNAGQVQVLFNDQTRLVVGPHSSLLVSDYLMRGQTASKVVVDALGGTFRFITGNSPKSAYQITTPTGTLGVRGTAFDFDVAPGTGETHVVLYHGGVEICGLDGTCRLLSHACDVGIIASQQRAALVGRADGSKAPILRRFPYLASQIRLRGDFRVAGVDLCQETTTVAEGGATITIIVPARPPGTPPPAPGEGPPPPPTEEPPPPPDRSGHDNRGIGNGGDTPSEGGTETGNPHAGGGQGKGHAFGHAAP